MPRQSLLGRIVPASVFSLGTLLILMAFGIAIVNRSEGEVVILGAEGLAHLVLVKDVAEVHEIEIVNRAGRQITLNSVQGWG